MKQKKIKYFVHFQVFIEGLSYAWHCEKIPKKERKKYAMMILKSQM